MDKVQGGLVEGKLRYSFTFHRKDGKRFYSGLIYATKFEADVELKLMQDFWAVKPC